jgi:hypothetical protein
LPIIPDFPETFTGIWEGNAGRGNRQDCAVVGANIGYEAHIKLDGRVTEIRVDPDWKLFGKEE